MIRKHQVKPVAGLLSLAKGRRDPVPGGSLWPSRQLLLRCSISHILLGRLAIDASVQG